MGDPGLLLPTVRGQGKLNAKRDWFEHGEAGWAAHKDLIPYLDKEAVVSRGYQSGDLMIQIRWPDGKTFDTAYFNLSKVKES